MRRKWWWAGGGAAAILIAVAVLARRPDPLAYLAPLHGRQVEVNLDRWYERMGAKRPAGERDLTLVVFANEQANAVLQRVRKHYQNKETIAEYELLDDAPIKGSSIVFQVASGPFAIATKSTATSLLVPGGVMYFSGQQAEREREMYEPGSAKLDSCCILLIPHETTWLDHATKTVRGWLGMG